LIHFAFYVPVSHAASVKAALFAVGAGRIGNYDCCAFETRGVGQFRPLAGSDPTLGNIGEIEVVEEVKVELVFDDHLYPVVVQALLDSHPYETPAYYGIKILG